METDTQPVFLYEDGLFLPHPLNIVVLCACADQQPVHKDQSLQRLKSTTNKMLESPIYSCPSCHEIMTINSLARHTCKPRKASCTSKIKEKDRMITAQTRTCLLILLWLRQALNHYQGIIIIRLQLHSLPCKCGVPCT